jgi:pimeloyl-ACP methyl ester carboxylesterase
MLFLHGILGRRANWRSFARKFVRRRADLGAILVDLRKHGDSQEFAAPHTVAACAQDLRELIADLALPVRGVAGHSFGGKVALSFAAAAAGVEELWLLDSMPGVRDGAAEPGSPIRVIQILRDLAPRFSTRDEFVRAVIDAGIHPTTAHWLAMNVRREGHSYVFCLDLAAVDELLADYLRRDDWNVLEQPPAGGRIHVVVADRSNVWKPEDRARASRLAEAGTLELTVMPDVGHWMHVEDQGGLLDILTG